MLSLFRPKSQSIALAPDPAPEVRSLTLEDIFGVPPVSSGASVSPATAMRAPAVRAAVQAISEAAGQLPLLIVETASGGLRKPAEGHPLFSLLNRVANDWTSSTQFREQLVRDALYHGNGYAWIDRDSTGTVRALIRIKPADIQVDEDPIDIFAPPVYRLRGLVVDRSNLIHLRCPLGPDGAAGRSPVQDCREAIGLSIALEQHAARLFGRGARPSGILSTDDKLGAEVAARVKSSWQAAHGGSNSGGTAVLENGLKFQSISLNSVDAQFAEMRAFQIAEIARAFRVPPVLLQDYGRATWANSSEMARQFVNFSLQPWLQKVEGEFALKLLSPDERDHLCFEHDIDQLVNSDPAARAKTAQAFRSAGVMTANELRRIENLPPRPDGDTLGSPFTTSNTVDPAPTDPAPADPTGGSANG